MARPTKDKEHTHFMCWYNPFDHWAMGVTVPFGDLSSTSTIAGDTAWLTARSRSPTRWDILAVKSPLNRY